jgi:hypothetical protein
MLPRFNQQQRRQAAHAEVARQFLMPVGIQIARIQLSKPWLSFMRQQLPELAAVQRSAPTNSSTAVRSPARSPRLSA